MNEFPHDSAIERAVLGSLLYSPENYALVMDDLDSDLFYAPKNKTVFKALQNVVAKAEPSDQLVQAELNGLVDKPGLLIADLIHESALNTNLPQLVKHLQELKARRSALRTGYTLIERAQEKNDSETIYDVIDETQRSLLDIKESKMNLPTTVGDAMLSTAMTLKKRTEAGKLTALMTGYQALDDLTNGFAPGELIIIAARPGMGKTAFFLQFLYELSLKGTTSLAYSLEMSTEQLALRLLSNISTISHKNVMNSWLLQEKEREQIAEIVKDSKDLSLYIQEVPGLTAENVYNKTKRFMLAEKKLACIGIDHATRMGGGKKNGDNYHKFTEISRSLKDTALKLQIPVIALLQLNRGVEMRDDKRPQLRDLRDTGAWEEDADKILFLYRDSYYNKESDDEYGAEVIVAKNRSGSCGTVNLLFRADCVRFYERVTNGNSK